MVRKILTILLIVLFSFNIYSQSKKEKKAIKMWGIKSVTEFVTENINGKETTRKDSYKMFDKNANVTYSEEYFKDGKLKHKETNKLDSKGNKIEEVVFDAAESKPVKNYKRSYKYDSEENKIEEIEYDTNDKIVKKTHNEYNSSNEKVSEVEYDANGNVVKRTSYSYDSKGFRSVKTEFDSNNKVISKRIYKFE